MSANEPNPYAPPQTETSRRRPFQHLEFPWRIFPAGFMIWMGIISVREAFVDFYRISRRNAWEPGPSFLILATLGLICFISAGCIWRRRNDWAIIAALGAFFLAIFLPAVNSHR